MPVVAIDVRGVGAGMRELVMELRRFDGLRVPAWRPWSRVVAPHAVHALGGRLPRALPCPGAATYTVTTDERTLRDATLVLCPSQAALAQAAARPGVREERLRVVPHGTPVRPVLRASRNGEVVALGGDPSVLRTAAGAAGGELRALDEPAGVGVLVDLRDGLLFGDLALGALAAGIPVVTTTTGAVAEAIGDAGVLVEDPADSAQLAAALRRALEDREALAAAGRARAALFTWTGTAEATVMAYRELW